MHTSLLRLCIIAICCLPAFASAETRTIHVEWGYTAPDEPTVTGYKLYQEGVLACQVADPQAIDMDCEVTLTAETTNFTLTATFDDNTESPHSTPFAYTLSGEPVTSPPPESGTETPGTGSKLFTFSLQTATDPTTLSGYNVYLNNSLLCETNDPALTTLSCKADLLPEPMTFSITEVSTDGSESVASNLLVFDPTAYPELFNTKLVSFNWEYAGPSEITGFRIYQNNVLICQTTDTTARQLSCTTDISGSSVSYGITAVNSDGTESDLSNLLTYSADTATTTPPENVPLTATLSAAPLTGTAPLSVDFNATQSTGAISSYLWDFGDGSTSEGSTATHTYTAAGTFTATLTVTDNSGLTSTTTTTITTTQPDVASTPPTVVISSSTAAGAAPLTVNFDGSASTAATNASIVSHSWDFGDGSTATGATTSHTFTSAGTFQTTLNVTDSQGLTSSASTPVVVTAPVTINAPPTASASASSTSGALPLTVSFDGSTSSDSDGTITSYIWNFGDGSSASGNTTTHTYTTAATYTATLQIEDDKGATDSFSIPIVVQLQELPPAFEMKTEIGEISVTGSWQRVTFDSTFQNPIVIAGPAGFNDADPGVIRLRNVDSSGFDIRFTEWNYLDGVHPDETVSYLVMEKGRSTLPDGSSIEAGSFIGTTSFKTVAFNEAFTTVPVVVSTVASENETDTISGRLKSITTSGFAYYFREQERNTNKHATETVNYIAWQPGKGNIGDLQFEVTRTPNAVTHGWYSVTFQNSFEQTPLLLADMQTTSGADTSSLRIQNTAATGFQIKVEEETSKDTEVTHTPETVGFIALNQNAPKVLAKFSWDFDEAQESAISGFQILANGNVICSSDESTTRELICTFPEPTGSTEFSIKTVDLSGATSTPSNILNYAP